MIYTVGHKKMYDEGLKNHGDTFFKSGKSEDGYSGGSVWKTRKEAESFLTHHTRLRGFAVYGVEADWLTDTEYAEGEPFSRLVKSSRIVSLE